MLTQSVLSLAPSFRHNRQIWAIPPEILLGDIMRVMADECVIPGGDTIKTLYQNVDLHLGISWALC